jgi:hypothetical protein
MIPSKRRLFGIVSEKILSVFLLSPVPSAKQDHLPNRPNIDSMASKAPAKLTPHTRIHHQPRQGFVFLALAFNAGCMMHDELDRV